MKHIYKNAGVDYFAADSIEQAVEFSKKYLLSIGIPEKDWTDDCLANIQVPDDEVLKALIETNHGSESVSMSAGAWAQIASSGFLFSTEW